MRSILLLLTVVMVAGPAHAAPPQFNTLTPNDTVMVYQNNVLGTLPIEQLIESARGISGQAGPKGASFYTGSGAPSALLGANGDSYVDSATGNLWQRGSGGWVNSGYVMVPVQSVFGRTGNVTINLGDLPAGIELQSNKGATNGYASLVGGAVPLTQLPTIPSGQISGLAPSATTDTTNASNIGSGMIGAARLPAATSSALGGVKPDGTTISNASGAISVAYGTVAGTAAQGNDSRITGSLAATTAASTYAPLASPALTGTPTVPTASAGANTTQAASTAFVGAAVGMEASRAQTSEALALPAAGGTLTGTISGGTLSATNATAATAAASGVSGAVLRSLGAITGDTLSLLDFGAKCDGSTDDSAAIMTSMATGKRISIPSGLICVGASIAQNSITSSFVGPGQIKTSDGNLRGPIVNQISVRPNVASQGVLTGFNGSMGGVPLAIEQRITGAATLGTPSTYLYTAETSAMLVNGYNASGYQGTGRTGASLLYLGPSQYGQGDYGAIWCNGIVASSYSGATNFLQSPAVQCMEGQLSASANGAYIEYLGDMDIVDNGFDIAGYGTVMNFNRTKAVEGIGAGWIADWRHANGTAPIDSFYVAAGPAGTGIDLSQTSLIYSRAGILALSSGGTGYTQGDLLTVSGGTALTPTVVQASTVTGGVIKAITVVNSGIYTTPPLNNGAYGALTVAGGTGTGAGVSGAYNDGTAIVLPGSGGCISPATQVGSPTTVLAGYWGTLCLSTGSLVWGSGNTVPAPFGGLNDVLLGQALQAYGTGNTLLGMDANDEAGNGALIWANGTPSGYGAAQTSQRILWGSGTGAMRLTTNGAAASPANSYPIVASSAHNISFRVTAIDTSNGDAAIWKVRNGLATRVSSGAVAYAGDGSSATAPDISTGAGSTSSMLVSADATNHALNFTVTPPSGTGHTWHAEAVLTADQMQ